MSIINADALSVTMPTPSPPTKYLRGSGVLSAGTWGDFKGFCSQVMTVSEPLKQAVK